MQIGYMQSDGDNSDIVDLERSNRLVKEIVPLVKRFMLEHHEYNSHGGLIKLQNNNEFMAQMVGIVCAVMDIGGGQ